MSFKKVGVVGAGTMGQSIAEMLASKGIEVYLLEKTPELLDQAIEGITASLDRQIEKWVITNTEKKLALSRIHKALVLEQMNECGMIIESITEDMEAKRELLNSMDRICGPDVILASNTSALSLTELAAQTVSPERVIGLHFIFPASKIDLVEIIRGLRTTDDTYARTRAFVQDTLGKKSIQVHESPGFVTTRLICTLINEALHTLEEGVATVEDIDTAMRIGYAFHYGPLEMADRFGLDAVYAAMERMFREFGDTKYRPSYLLKKMVRAGQLGMKTGQGFYRYDKDGVRL